MKMSEIIIRRLLLPVLAALFLAASSPAAGCGFPPGRELSGRTETRETDAVSPGLPAPGLPSAFNLSAVPAFAGIVWADVNDDIPFFEEDEMEAARRLTKALAAASAAKEKTDVTASDPVAPQPEQSCQAYGALDTLGRCTGACVLVGAGTLPQEERGNIGMIRPTGWHTVKYDGIDGNYLYNRCHLIGFQLTGQDANDRNLITGTRFMNVEGMLPFEDSVLAYVRGTGNHVLYRVTPVFRNDNLLSDGVLMEARSVEDPLVQFCVFCYNVQPGITIDYATGESAGPVFTGKDSFTTGAGNQPGDDRSGSPESGDGQTGKADSAGARERWAGPAEEKAAGGEREFIVNVRSGKFHLPGCKSVGEMSEKNMQGFKGFREELIEMGYAPCKNCLP